MKNILRILIVLCFTTTATVAQSVDGKFPALHISCYDTEDPVVVDNNTCYVIEVRNEGNAACTGISLQNLLPQKAVLVNANGPTFFEQQDQQLIFSPVAILQPGEKLVYRIYVKITAQGFFKNTAILTADSFSIRIYVEESTTVSSSNSPIPALHFSTYDTEDMVEVNHNTIYVNEVRNEGTAPVTNIKLDNMIPPNCQWIAAQGPTSFKVQNERVIFDAVDILLPGEKLTYKITVRALQPGTAKNVAFLQCDSFNHFIQSDEGTNIYQR